MKRTIRVFFFQSDGDGFGVHNIFILGSALRGWEIDGGYCVGWSLGIGRYTEGFEVRGDIGEVEKVGSVRNGFVVESETSCARVRSRSSCERRMSKSKRA